MIVFIKLSVVIKRVLSEEEFFGVGSELVVVCQADVLDDVLDEDAYLTLNEGRDSKL